MHLVHLHLTRPHGPTPEQADANLIHDTLWALTPPDAGIEHISARAGPHGIDLTLFLHHHIPDPDPDHYARTLLATLTPTSPTLNTWHITTTH